MSYIEVSKFDFDLHTANVADYDIEKIRWSSPVRWNYYKDGKYFETKIWKKNGRSK